MNENIKIITSMGCVSPIYFHMDDIIIIIIHVHTHMYNYPYHGCIHAVAWLNLMVDIIPKELYVHTHSSL